jgi:hypothetical protein
VAELKEQGIKRAYLDGNDAMMDIMRLTCIEAGISFDRLPKGIVLRASGRDFEIIRSKSRNP